MRRRVLRAALAFLVCVTAVAACSSDGRIPDKTDHDAGTTTTVTAGTP
jgi:hypothetical protein